MKYLLLLLLVGCSSRIFPTYKVGEVIPVDDTTSGEIMGVPVKGLYVLRIGDHMFTISKDSLAKYDQ